MFIQKEKDNNNRLIRKAKVKIAKNTHKCSKAASLNNKNDSK